ncbi:MAG TPA: GGDEF domain-containing response regulator [Kofleriaceae bacterium]|nr:GGDEF domain-containing response regulator [Kofleriaceae bacterium]
MADGTPRRSVLFVDPDPARSASCAEVAAHQGIVADATVPAAVLEAVERRAYGVIVVDLEQVGPGGGALIDELGARCPDATFIALARPAGLARAPEQRLGVGLATLLVEPFTPGELATALGDAFELREARQRHRATRFDRAAILLVEDNEGDADLVTDHLQDICGAVVSHASRIEDAIRALGYHSYDFVISDLTLPDAQRLDAVQRLLVVAPDTPLIVLTGIDDEDLAVEAVKQGAQDYLVKGRLDAPSLRRTLRHARERVQTWNMLRHQTRHDPLTGAANRAALRERIETTLARARRRLVAFAVLMIDLDNFKTINDTCGHAAGDVVLCEVAERLRQAVRTSDVVARLGGDEFAVFLDDLWPDSDPLEVAERIRSSLEQPVVVGGRSLMVTASIGLAHYPEVSGSVDDLLAAADAAMYTSKGRGRNNVQVWSSGPVKAAWRR